MYISYRFVLLFTKTSNPLNSNTISGSVSYENLAKRIAPLGEVLYFDYGVVVMWGFTENEEKQILKDLQPFQEESFGKKLTS